jgi:hypothetical protein
MHPVSVQTRSFDSAAVQQALEHRAITYSDFTRGTRSCRQVTEEAFVAVECAETEWPIARVSYVLTDSLLALLIDVSDDDQRVADPSSTDF